MEKTATKQNTPKTAEAHSRYVRISPRKMRLVTNLVKGMWANEALVQLAYTNKRAAKIVFDCVKSAIANAENNFKMNKDNLVIKTITCDSGPKLMRFTPRAQGRATPIRRPTSHLHVVLEEKAGAGKKKRAIFGSTKKEELEVKEVKPQEEKSEKTHVSDANRPADHNEVKPSEKIKQNKAQQKRRLFNRKSGV